VTTAERYFKLLADRGLSEQAIQFTREEFAKMPPEVAERIQTESLARWEVQR
jgi:hypothetical protein